MIKLLKFLALCLSIFAGSCTVVHIHSNDAEVTSHHYLGFHYLHVDSQEEGVAKTSTVYGVSADETGLTLGYSDTSYIIDPPDNSVIYLETPKNNKGREK